MADISGARLNKAIEAAEVLAALRGNRNGRAVRWSDLTDREFLARLKGLLDVADSSDVSDLLSSMAFGNNLLRNSSLAGGLEGWMRTGSGDANGDTAFDLRPAGQPWAGTEYPTIMLYQSSGDTTGWTRIESAPVKNRAGVLGTGWPCAAMARVEFSAQISTHDCTGTLFVRWFDKLGVHIGDSEVMATLTDQPGASDDPDDWPRIGGFATRPAGAAYVRPAIRKDASIFPAINSYLFVNKPQLLEAPPTKRKLSPYAPGSAGYIGSDAIQDDAVGPAAISIPYLSSIAADVGYLTAGEIASANYVPGEGGEGSYWNLDTGYGEVNGWDVRRQIAIDTGEVAFPATGGTRVIWENDGTVEYMGQTYPRPRDRRGRFYRARTVEVRTNVPISNWIGTLDKTYLAQAGGGGSVGFDAALTTAERAEIDWCYEAIPWAATNYWGGGPNSPWSNGGVPMMRLIISLWVTERVWTVGAGMVRWRVYKVS